jgi:hypothetical protein
MGEAETKGQNRECCLKHVGIVPPSDYLLNIEAPDVSGASKYLCSIKI